jgi:hypothetical protein
MISADIPQGGSAFGEYSAVKPLIAFAQELEQLLMLLGQVEPHGPFAWQVEEVNADEVEELASLLTLKFQTFEAVSVIGAESNVCLFPVRKQTPTPVSCQAA